MEGIETREEKYKDGRTTNNGWVIGSINVWNDYDFYLKLCSMFNQTCREISEDWYKQFKYLKWLNYSKKKKENESLKTSEGN